MGRKEGRFLLKTFEHLKIHFEIIRCMCVCCEFVCMSVYAYMCNCVYCACVCMCDCVSVCYASYVEIRTQPTGVSSFLPPSGPQ